MSENKLKDIFENNTFERKISVEMNMTPEKRKLLHQLGIYSTGKQGITIRFNNGDVIKYYPQEKEDMISVYEEVGGELFRELCRILEERKESDEK